MQQQNTPQVPQPPSTIGYGSKSTDTADYSQALAAFLAYKAQTLLPQEETNDYASLLAEIYAYLNATFAETPLPKLP